MKRKNRISEQIKLCAVALSMILWSMQVVAQEPTQTPAEADAHAAVAKLMAATPAAKDLLSAAKGVLVFPSIVKAGFIIGAQYGNGVLLEGNSEKGFYATGNYNIAAASYGLQAGVQSFGYAMVLMTDHALRYIETRSGFELGVGPSIVVVDAGVAKGLNTANVKKDIYAFTFGQQGLMAGLGLQGTKVTRLNP
jgi:lipid-binding SYLF domain-containing protein